MADDKRSRLKEWLETGEARLQPLSFSFPFLFFSMIRWISAFQPSAEIW